ncbi:MAG TPA: glycosyltransferase family 9 protein [Hanamia sp.]|jgi:ADP-heptose:LPS heptosyltransferase|nr:glycosyltransferase family 9 protein [Hanamia sp.]
MDRLKKNIIISRTDSIGDVVLTLPIAKILKDAFPEIKIAFLGREYTKPVVLACKYVDEFIDLKDFLKNDIQICNEKPEAILHVLPVSAIAKRSKQLRIQLRIGTTNRIYHWLTCNRFVRLSRKKSDLHEAQLNLQLLQPFGINKIYSLEEIATTFGFEKTVALKPEFLRLLNPEKFNLILHPKSQGSAREWGIENFITLIKTLDLKRFNIFISGTKNEHELLQPLLASVGESITDISGKMDLSQFISFINHCDGLVANSTGPLHIAAALNKYAFGIFSPMRPIHPGRWQPLGRKAKFFVLKTECNDCRNNENACHCIKEVSPEWLRKTLNRAAEEIGR